MNILIIKDKYCKDVFSVYTTENEIFEDDLQEFVNTLHNTYNEFADEIGVCEEDFINSELEKWHGLKCVAYNVISY